MTTYAIISLGGKQYRVSEGQRLLVDRLATGEGETFSPPVLLVGGDGGPQLSPTDITVTARVVGQQRGPKIRIGKYRKRTGYRRHTGFRAALTSIEIESIGGERGKSKTAPKEQTAPETAAEAGGGAGLPDGYDDLTVAEIKDAAGSWDAAALEAALAHERSHANRKGALAALQAASADMEGG